MAKSVALVEKPELPGREMACNFILRSEVCVSLINAACTAPMVFDCV